MFKGTNVMLLKSSFMLILMSNKIRFRRSVDIMRIVILLKPLLLMDK